VVKSCLAGIGFTREGVLDGLQITDVIKIPERKAAKGHDQDEALDRLAEFYANRSLYEAQVSAQAEIPLIMQGVETVVLEPGGPPRAMVPGGSLSSSTLGRISKRIRSSGEEDEGREKFK